MLNAVPQKMYIYTLAYRASALPLHLSTALPATRLFVKKRQDSFTHHTASVLMPHIKGYMTTSDVLVMI
jgi:hypothetical protein